MSSLRWEDGTPFLRISDPKVLHSRLEEFVGEHSSEFEVDHHCRNGGFPDVDCVELDDVNRDEEGIECGVTVNFEEVVSTGCRDVQRRFNKSCRFTMTINNQGRIGVEEDEYLWDGDEYGD